jgi:hypothetical protein
MLMTALVLPFFLATRPQVDPFEKLVTCEYHRAEIRTVVSDLLGKASISFSCDRPIRGKVSLRLTAMSLEKAFMRILDSCHLTWRSGSGVIQIVHKERPAEEHAQPDSPTAFPKDLADSVSVNHQSAEEVIWRLLSKSDKSFVIGAGLQKKITLNLAAQPLGETLSTIIRSCQGELSYDADVWTVRGPFGN